MSLEREEYVEQAYFFRLLGDRILDGVPLQELLSQAKLETLASTRLPLAIDFLLGELVHTGVIGPAMARLAHYFAPFQTYIMSEAEEERGRFDMRLAAPILQREAEFRATHPDGRCGLFLFQFETLCRNRLRYDAGLKAISDDPMYDGAWQEWILTVRRQIGLVDFASLLYARSELYRRHNERSDKESTTKADRPVLFGEKEGKIARANIGKDPLYLFAALQRHLGYPAVPRPKRPDPARQLLPQLVRRMEKVELRLKLLEEEQRRESIDLSRFYPPPPDTDRS
jgi:hypothetical protein